MLDSAPMQAQDILDSATEITGDAAESLEKPFDLVVGKLQNWIKDLITMLPNLAVALLVLLAFWVTSRFVGSTVRRLFNRFVENSALTHLAERVSRFVVLLTGLFVALGVLQLDQAVTSLLAGAGVIGLAIGFAFQNIIANFLSGTLISIRKPFIPGDIVEIAEYFGTVAEINLRTTNMMTQQGQLVLIPNKEVFEQAIINYSRTGHRRVDLAVGVSYGEDLDKVEQVTREAVAEKVELLDEREPEVFFTEFGDSSINLVVRYWIRYGRQVDFVRATSDGIRAIKKAYDANDIMIPFPIRTLDFGIKGGEKLSEVWPQAAPRAEPSAKKPAEPKAKPPAEPSAKKPAKPPAESKKAS